VIRCLICGTATDGATNECFLPKDERELVKYLGGNFIERRLVSPTASSLSLTYTPWTSPTNQVNGLSNYLYSALVSANSVSFGAIGLCATGATNTVDLTYTPYLGVSDLLFAARKYLQITGTMPYILRLGGVAASLSVSGWAFSAKYPGQRYNSVVVSGNGSNLIRIYGMEPNYPAVTYTGDWDTIYNSIYRDFYFGICPIIATNSSTTMPSGIYHLTSGTDGTPASGDITSFFDMIDLPSEVSHILMLYPLDSNVINLAYANFDASLVQPRAIITPAPAYTDPASTWAVTQLTSIPYRHDLVSSVIGTITTVLDGKEVTRYSAEEAVIGYANSTGLSMTNIPLSATSFTPDLSSDDLNLLKNAGWMAITRHIKNDISTFKGTTSAADTSFIYNSKCAEIYAIGYGYLEQFLGGIIQQGRKPEMEKELMGLLQNISFFTPESVSVTIVGDSIIVEITGMIPNEILKISFTAQNR